MVIWQFWVLIVVLVAVVYEIRRAQLLISSKLDRIAGAIGDLHRSSEEASQRIDHVHRLLSAGDLADNLKALRISNNELWGVASAIHTGLLGPAGISHTINSFWAVANDIRGSIKK